MRQIVIGDSAVLNDELLRLAKRCHPQDKLFPFDKLNFTDMWNETKFHLKT